MYVPNSLDLGCMTNVSDVCNVIELSESRTVWLHFGTETEESVLFYSIFLRVSASLGNIGSCRACT